ncbi:MAG: 4Fe-4S dicluster domain-containing protein [Candidatus Latescibacterota bacterium]|jgi:ferredoxin|nr:MAG: 4Fe-4S dicluster domain-containing protein [Candidatus Latescibacterota bacterium]
MKSQYDRVAVDTKSCIVCGACAAACPTEALVVEGMTLVVLEERCRPCGQAALVCPTGALRCPGKRVRPRRGSPEEEERR